MDARLIPASPVVVAEDLDFIFILIVRKNGVNEENRRLVLFVVGIDRLLVFRADRQWSVLGSDPQLIVFLSRFCHHFFPPIELITFANLMDVRG